MGMAASQARFLGLTARKSNVEYQGQQINQQRTALSNESANLYNEMMQLNVPTPPATSDFYSTSYVLEGSSDSYAKSDYKMGNIVKTYQHENEYLVTLITNREYTQNVPKKFKIGRVAPSQTEGDRTTAYTIPFIDAGTGKTTELTYDIEKSKTFLTDEGKSSAVEVNTIYAVAADQAKNLAGFTDCFPNIDSVTDENGNSKYYFYRDNDGKNNFILASDLESLIKGDDGFKENQYFGVSSSSTYTKEETIQVNAYLETSSSTGRYSTIRISGNEDYPVNLQNQTFSLTTVKEMDQAGYDDAYNDYEYQKGLYEKSISDINAKTEVIQNEDQQLELRLQQLNTEQQAISTEMDSVSKVIQDNVEKTFKVFA